MRRMNDLRCPTCRSPRDGVSRAQADAAARTNYAREQAPQLLRVLGRFSRQPSGPSLLFFANEASDATPFDAIERAAVRVTRVSLDGHDAPQDPRVEQELVSRVLEPYSNGEADESDDLDRMIRDRQQAEAQRRLRANALLEELIALRPELAHTLAQNGLVLDSHGNR